MFSRQELCQDFVALGVKPGDVVMLHASVRAVGAVAGGADQIHLALEDALGQQGTMLMYVGCQHGFDDVGRGNLSYREEQEILQKLPAFDADRERAARDFGVLAELFRSYSGTACSQQVGSRMAARGFQAKYLLADHPHNFSYGKGSPLDKFFLLNGKILLLGSDHDAVTFLHYTEHCVDIPNKKVVRYQVPLPRNGGREWVSMEEFDTSSGVHPSWPDRFFAQIVDDFIAYANFSGSKVGEAQAYLLPCRALHDFAAQHMRNMAGQST
jgi:aminoglycoside 3-N-acetyltransferase